MYGYGLRSDAIVGYTWQADIWCPACIERANPSIDGNAEAVLDTLAQRNDIDRSDETSFDSGDFPKIIFAVMVEDDESCGQCGESLISD